MSETKYLFLVFIAIFFFSSCGRKSDQSSEEKKDTVVNTPGEQQITTGGEVKSNELGIKEGKPADYPSDIPEPINSKVLGTINTSEGTVVTFESTSKPRDIFNAFRTSVEKSGFSTAGDEMMTDDGGLAAWKMDKREVSIMLAWDKEKEKSSVVITYR
jgi:hypothetical protein